MTEKEEKLGKKETQAIGRFLGWLSKKNPELYAELMEEAESRGVKPHELIEESLWFYFMDLKSKQAGADISQHLASLDFWLYIEEKLVERRIAQILDFFDKFFTLYTELITLSTEKVEQGRIGEIAKKKAELLDIAIENFRELSKMIRQRMVKVQEGSKK